MQCTQNREGLSSCVGPMAIDPRELKTGRALIRSAEKPLIRLLPWKAPGFRGPKCTALAPWFLIPAPEPVTGTGGAMTVSGCVFRIGSAGLSFRRGDCMNVVFLSFKDSPCDFRRDRPVLFPPFRGMPVLTWLACRYASKSVLKVSGFPELFAEVGCHCRLDRYVVVFPGWP